MIERRARWLLHRPPEATASAEPATFDKLGEQVALEHAESQSESIASRQTLVDLETQRDIRKLGVESGLLNVERNQALPCQVMSVSSPPKFRSSTPYFYAQPRLPSRSR